MKMVLNNSWLLLISALIPVASAFAEEGGHAVTTSWSGPLGIGLGIAIAVFGAALGQGRIAAAFMEGVSRNPSAQKSMFIPMIVCLALVESLVLFTFLICQSLLGKI